MKKRLRPSTPASQPLIGKTIAFETRYEVRTQVLSVVARAEISGHIWQRYVIDASVEIFPEGRYRYDDGDQPGIGLGAPSRVGLFDSDERQNSFWRTLIAE